MPLICFVDGCFSKSNRTSNISFHKFPEEKKLRDQWEEAILILNQQSNAKEHLVSARICSRHFTDECFQQKFTFSHRTLIKNSVPSLFPKLIPDESFDVEILSEILHSDDISIQEVDECPSPKRVKYDVQFTTPRAVSSMVNDEVIERDSTFPPPKQDSSVDPPTTPKTKEINTLKESLTKEKRRVRAARAKLYRAQRKLASMKELFDDLKSKSYISDNANETLQSLYNEKSLLDQIKKGKSKNEWPPAIRAFALTVNFYSPRAYDYIRKVFFKKLPAPSTMRKWYQSINGEPGMCAEALNALKMKVDEAKAKNKKVVCSLMFDEMAIKKQIEWDKHKKKFTGYVDYGTKIEKKESLPEAKEALTFMLNCINDRWKIPIGYFLVNGVTSAEKASMVTQVLEFLSESDITVASITFDGPPSNLAMCKHLGASFDDKDNMILYMIHPTTNKKVYLFLDICHMIKLVRNTFASRKVFYDENNDKIEWDYIERLHSLQNEKGLHFANKLGRKHIEWVRQKMKVNLAVQTLSNSVADALEYLESKKVDGFVGCAPTVKFIRMFNRLFDVGNSKTKYAKKFKKPIYEQTEEKYFIFFEEAEKYIRSLKVKRKPRKNRKGILLPPRYDFILKTQSKTGFLGFIMGIRNFKDMYNDLAKDQKIIEYLSTYKVSQDHLETFFSAIRSRGGFNNNPTAQQFSSAFKRLLINNEIKSSVNGNCNVDNTCILSVSSCLKVLNSSNIETNQINTEEVVESETLKHFEMCPLVDDVVGYIAGYVERKLTSKIKCIDCLNAIKERPSYSNELIDLKNWGGRINPKKGLFHPKQDIVSICRIAERNISFLRASNKHKLPTYHQIIINSCFRQIGENIFNNMDNHRKECDIFEDHRYFIIKLIISEYTKIKSFYIADKDTEQLVSVASRNLLTNLIKFKGQ